MQSTANRCGGSGSSTNTASGGSRNGGPTDGNGCEVPEDALIKTDFDDSTWRSVFNDGGLERLSTVSEGAYDGKSLRVHVPKGQHYGTNTGHVFQNEPEELYAQFMLKFGENWDFRGGKLPGFAGTYGRAGWGSRIPDGTNGWSARGGFDGRNSDTNEIGYYSYEMGINQYGRNYKGGDVQTGQWYCVKQYIKLNTPGENDGILRMWLDGEKIVEEQNIRWRDTTELKIRRYWFNIYYGGSWSAPQDMNVYFDNFAVWNP